MTIDLSIDKNGRDKNGRHDLGNNDGIVLNPDAALGKALAVTLPNWTPKEIVAELDKYIVGQDEAKKLVAIALRNRYRRALCAPALAEEIIPKNMLMIGPTGCGKTEIARRLAKLVGAPFIKVEATRYTEVGYVGRDVESIVRDLLEIAIKQMRQRAKQAVKSAALGKVHKKLLRALVGKDASIPTLKSFSEKLQRGELEEKMVTLEFKEHNKPQGMMEVPGLPGAQVGMIQIGEMMGKMFNHMTEKTLPVKRARVELLEEEMEQLIDQDAIVRAAIEQVEQNGIVFIDEFDKICVRENNGGRADVSREGVQRDLLPLIEGTTVATRHGVVKTDYILFIASGAFHLSKPSDLLPELQGRLPIRVKLNPLTKEDFKRILLATEHSLLKQYHALLAVEGLDLQFEPAAVDKLVTIAYALNNEVENIGARRLHTVLEKLLEDVNFNADSLYQTAQKSHSNSDGVANMRLHPLPPLLPFLVDLAMVERELEPLQQNQDLKRFIL